MIHNNNNIDTDTDTNVQPVRNSSYDNEYVRIQQPSSTSACSSASTSLRAAIQYAIIQVIGITANDIGPYKNHGENSSNDNDNNNNNSMVVVVDTSTSMKTTTSNKNETQNAINALTDLTYQYMNQIMSPDLYTFSNHSYLNNHIINNKGRSMKRPSSSSVTATVPAAAAVATVPQLTTKTVNQYITEHDVYVLLRRSPQHIQVQVKEKVQQYKENKQQKQQVQRKPRNSNTTTSQICMVHASDDTNNTYADTTSTTVQRKSKVNTKITKLNKKKPAINATTTTTTAITKTSSKQIRGTKRLKPKLLKVTSIETRTKGTEHSDSDSDSDSLVKDNNNDDTDDTDSEDGYINNTKPITNDRRPDSINNPILNVDNDNDSNSDSSMSIDISRIVTKTSKTNKGITAAATMTAIDRLKSKQIHSLLSSSSDDDDDNNSDNEMDQIISTLQIPQSRMNKTTTKPTPLLKNDNDTRIPQRTTNHKVNPYPQRKFTLGNMNTTTTNNSKTNISSPHSNVLRINHNNNHTKSTTNNNNNVDNNSCISNKRFKLVQTKDDDDDCTTIIESMMNIDSVLNDDSTKKQRRQHKSPSMTQQYIANLSQDSLPSYCIE